MPPLRQNGGRASFDALTYFSTVGAESKPAGFSWTAPARGLPRRCCPPRRARPVHVGSRHLLVVDPVAPRGCSIHQGGWPHRQLRQVDDGEVGGHIAVDGADRTLDGRTSGRRDGREGGGTVREAVPSATRYRAHRVARARHSPEALATRSLRELGHQPPRLGDVDAAGLGAVIGTRREEPSDDSQASD